MFTVVEKRAKSYKLQNADGFQFFIKKAWMRKDGSFTPAAFKAEGEAIKNKAVRETSVVKLPEANWESEKCLGVDYEVEDFFSGKYKKIRMFFPKSMVKEGFVPSWLFDKNYQKAMEKLPGRAQDYVLVDAPEAFFTNANGKQEKLVEVI